MSSHILPIRLYLSVFGALMALTVMTVWVSFFNLGFFNVFVAVTIAVLKALVVILFFMHVRYADRLTQVFVASGFVWLVIMAALALSDYLSRGW